MGQRLLAQAHQVAEWEALFAFSGKQVRI